MGRLVEYLDTAGGHIIVALFVFLVGVSLVCFHQDVGKEVLAGALGSLWTVLRVAKGGKE